MVEEQEIDDLPTTQPVPIRVDDPRTDQVDVDVDVNVLAAIRHLPEKMKKALLLYGDIQVMHNPELNFAQAKRLLSLKEMTKWNADALKVYGLDFNTPGNRGCGAMPVVVFNMDAKHRDQMFGNWNDPTCRIWKQFGAIS